MLVVLNQYTMQTSTMNNFFLYWIYKLVYVYGLMHWRIGWCIESTCRLTFTDPLTRWLCVESTCWLTFTNRCIDVLVGILNQHVGWRLLVHWRVGWYVESTSWLTITVLLKTVIADQLLHLVIKETKNKKLYLYYIISGIQLYNKKYHLKFNHF